MLRVGSFALLAYYSPCPYLSFGLSLLSLACGSFHEVLDDFLQRLHVDLLANISIVDQAIFGIAPLLQLDTQVDIFEHDLFQHLLPCSIAFAGDDVVQSL